MYTIDSTISEVLNNPVGKDVVDKLLQTLNKPDWVVKNNIVGGVKLKSLIKLSKGLVDENFLHTLCFLLNLHSDKIDDALHLVDKQTWWKEACIYQIYPRSFCDSNGDGIGDINGIISKLDYLEQLGVNCIWLSPIYDSPNDDNGYDIRDYQKICPEFGTMDDFDNLLAELHSRGIKLVMDLVVNHTSDEHKWFVSALNEENSPYENYYIWRDGDENTPPNNWQSFFSGSAWKYYPQKKKWVLHLFSEKQPDLNWENPYLRNEIADMVNWWLDKGVDGFRLDVINYISKRHTLPNGSRLVTDLLGYTGIEHYFFGPHLHEYLRELNLKAFAPHSAVTVGETPGVGLNMARQLAHESRHELDMVFCFDHLETSGHSRFDTYKYDLRFLKKYFTRWQTDYQYGCWNSLFFENHDNPRMVSKINPDLQYRAVVAKLLCVLQFSLRGTPFVYQGQELGLANTIFEQIDDLRDIESINLFKKLQPSLGTAAALAKINAGTRDNARTPMPWTKAENAGFTSGTPWIRTADDSHTHNVEAQSKTDGCLAFYKKMISIRASNKTLIYGEFEPMHQGAENVFYYKRTLGDTCYFVEINLTQTPQKKLSIPRDKLVISNYSLRGNTLSPYEANIYTI